MAAKEEVLGQLHVKVANVMIRALEAHEVDDEGNVIVLPTPVNPALLSVMTKFLKDNDITCTGGVGSKADELRERLQKQAKVNRVSHTA